MTIYVAKAPNKQGLVDYTPEENATWQRLIIRQKKTIKNRACSEFIEGLQKLDLSETHVPQLPEITEKIACTSWKAAPALGTILVEEFFAMLSRREFPVATFIRVPQELDYLKQPDIFHEVFGHCSLLTNAAYADFVQWYGQFASTLSTEQQKILSRLFWFTIEFGLVKTDQGVRIYGGGILSSHQETIYSLEDAKVMRKPFSLHEVLLTKYRYDVIQDRYFIIDSLDSFYHMMDEKELLEALNEIRDDQKKTFIIC